MIVRTVGICLLAAVVGTVSYFAIGKGAIEVLEPGKRAQLNYRDYPKPGDNRGIQVDLVNNHVLGLTVSTHLDNPQEILGLKVIMEQLNNGTSYAADIKLDAQAKGLTVTIQNTGYRKAN